MQNLQARFGKCVVKSGPLAGTTFDAVAPDRLRKAAKRYSDDPEFQKYAKSFVLLEDLREVEKEPEPCALVAPVKDLVPMGKSLWRRVRERLWWSLMAFLQNKYCRYLLIFLFLGVFLRQSFSKALGKLLVTSVRLTMRRCISFLVMMAEGIFDELIYQLDYVLRDALPAGMNLPEATAATMNWLSHTLSGAVGALIATFVTRRMPLQQ